MTLGQQGHSAKRKPEKIYQLSSNVSLDVADNFEKFQNCLLHLCEYLWNDPDFLPLGKKKKNSFDSEYWAQVHFVLKEVNYQSRKK